MINTQEVINRTLRKITGISNAQEVINRALRKITGISNANFLSNEGFEALADWSEQQEWWNRFAKLNDLGSSCWRATFAANPHLFALKLFRFVADWRYPTGNDGSDSAWR